jgi:hypothetical protein
VQKESHVIKGQDLQERLVRDPEFLLKITAGFVHNPDNKQRSSKCKSPTSSCPKNARQVSLIVASMPTVVDTLKEIFINLIHKDKLHTGMTTVASYGVCRKIYSEMTQKH